MKNFLKSTAIFACVALLFCACSEDTTDDMIPSVESSGIRSLTPGASRFEVTWSVPNDEQITICRLSWSNGAGVEGDYVVEANRTQVMSYTTPQTLPAGDYTVTLENYGDDRIDSSPTSKVVTVYDSSTYQAPEVATALVEAADSDVNLLFEWDITPEDCQGVIITYYTAADVKTSTNLLPFDQLTLLEGVKAGSNYSYTTIFKPEGGLDEVAIIKENAGVVPSATADAPAAPAEVIVNSGNYKFQVSVVPEDGAATAERVVIIYTNGESTYYRYIEASSTTIVELIEDMPLETYTVSARYIKGDQLSSEAEGDSQAAVYDLVEYTKSCSFPSYTSIYYESNFANSTSTEANFTQPLCINWDENIDCSKLTISYTKNMNGDIESDLDITADAKSGEITVLENAAPGCNYYAKIEFCPSGNGLDIVSKTKSAQFPYAPVPKHINSWGGDKGTTRYRHYFITPIGDGATLEKEGFYSPDYYATGEITADPLVVDCKGSQLYGEATIINGGITDYYWEEIWDDNYDYSTSTTSSGRKQFISNSTYTQFDQTVSYDLGAEFYLTSFVYTPHLSNLLALNTISTFSLYGLSADKNPLDKDLYDIATEDTKQYIGTDYEYFIIPDLSNWDCLLSYAEVIKPSTNNIDYNGDGVVDETDDSDKIYDGVSFDIPETASAVRYVRLQIHTTANAGKGYHIMELDHYHKGTTNGYDGDAYRSITKNTNVGGKYYPGVVMSSGLYTVPTYLGTENDEDE